MSDKKYPEIKSGEVLLKVEELSQHFGPLKAVDKVSFEIKKGEVFGHDRLFLHQIGIYPVLFTPALPDRKHLPYRANLNAKLKCVLGIPHGLGLGQLGDIARKKLIPHEEVGLP